MLNTDNQIEPILHGGETEIREQLSAEALEFLAENDREQSEQVGSRALALEEIRREVAKIQDKYDTADSIERVHPVYVKAMEVAKRVQVARENRLSWEYFTTEGHNSKAVQILRNAMAVMVGGKTLGHATKQVELTKNHLRNEESRIGGLMFGPVADNTEQGFFFDSDNHWFFFQIIYDIKGDLARTITLHYEIHENGIFKSSSDPSEENCWIDDAELENFEKAIEIYYTEVMKHVYGIDVKVEDLMAEIEEDANGLIDELPTEIGSEIGVTSNKKQAS